MISVGGSVNLQLKMCFRIFVVVFLNYLKISLKVVLRISGVSTKLTEDSNEFIPGVLVIVEKVCFSSAGFLFRLFLLK